MMKTQSAIKRTQLICLFLLTIGFKTFGQETLSLDKAIQLGLERNYDILVEQKNTDITKNNNTVGEAGMLPKVDLNVKQNNTFQKNIKTAFPTSTQGETGFRTVNPGISANWTLYGGGKARINKRRLEQLEIESQGNSEVVISNTVQAIILSYYKAVLEKERLTEFGRQIKLSRDKYVYTKVKSEIGSAASSELLLEEGNYLNDSISYFNQELVYRNSLRTLNTLLVQNDLDQDYTFENDLVLSQENFDFEYLSNELVGSNVDLRKLYLSQKVLESDLAISKTSRLPSLSLDAGYNDDRQSLDLSNAVFFTGQGFESGPDQRLNSITDTYFANLTLSFNLFNGKKTSRAIRNSMIKEDIGMLKMDQLRQSLSKDLRESYDTYLVRRKIHGITERKYAVAQHNLNNSVERYKNGTINSFDYRTVQNNNLSAAIDLLQSLYNIIDSQVSLLRLTGGIVRGYVQ